MGHINMPSHRRASTFMALLGVLLLVVVMPCTSGAVVAAKDTATTTSYVDYFLGDLFQNPSSMNHNKGPKAPPRFRPWRIIDVPNDSVLYFDCVGDVPTLHIIPRSNDCAANDDSTPPPTDNTGGIGGAQAGTMTATQYKFSSSDGGNGTAGYSALFWGPGPAAGAEEGEGAPVRPLMPVPKFQLKAILKAVAAMLESSWREESGDDVAVPASVAFSADMVVFYFSFNDRDPNWLVAMGREDVEFCQPWERLHGEIKSLNLGTVV